MVGPGSEQLENKTKQDKTTPHKQKTSQEMWYLLKCSNNISTCSFPAVSYPVNLKNPIIEK